MSQAVDLNYRPVELVGRDGGTIKITAAALLGSDTSRRAEHNHNEDYQRRGARCSACRWFSVYLYVTRDGEYVVHTVGDTVVPSEKRLSRVTRTGSPFAVIEALTVRRPNEEPYLTPQSQRALAEAAELDEGIREAYINRAVA